MIKWLRSLFAPDEDAQYILKCLKDAEQQGITSMRVVSGGGFQWAVTVDPVEVMNSPKFKEYQQQADELVNLCK